MEKLEIYPKLTEPNTEFHFSENVYAYLHRNKKLNWFQRWCFKFCFGITVINK